MNRVHFILFVADQQRSIDFYAAVLNAAPCLNVPGMTEFELPGGSILGLMPEKGIKRLLGEPMPDPSAARGIPRSEIYLLVDNATHYLDRALRSGATALSPVAARDWGDQAGYCLDPDGHLLAFAMEAGAD